MNVNDVKTDEIIINITTNVSDALEGIEKLKQAEDKLALQQTILQGKEDKLKEQRKEGKITAEQYAEAEKKRADSLAYVNEQIKVNRAEQRAYLKDIDNEIKKNEAAEGSIKKMRLELAQMRKEYESMSKSDREGEKGTTKLSQISKTTEELKKLEQAQGDWRREVGHYQNALENLSPTLAKTLQGFKAMSGGTFSVKKAITNVIPTIKAFGKQLLALMKIPIVWIIAAIATAVMNLVSAFKRNDEAMTQLQTAFAALEPIMELFRSIMDLIVDGVVALTKGLTGLVSSILSVIPAFDEASTAAQEYVQRLDALEEAERQYTVESAKNAAEVARLRGKAAQADKYTVEERKKFLEQAIKLEEEDLKSQLKIAEEKWKLAKDDAARRRDTSDETKNNIAQLEAAYYNAIANTEAGLKRLRGQMATFNNEIAKDAKDAAKKIMSNDALTAAERIKGLKDYKEATVEVAKKNLEIAKQNYANWKKYAPIEEMTKENNDAYKQAIADREAELKEANDEYKKEAKSLYSSLSATAKDYRDKETAARRAYEDAILAGMDDTLDKVLEMTKKEGDREIEDLKNKLTDEQNLTTKARDYINKTILEKQRQLNEKLVLTEAKYWSEVREIARDTITEIAAMNDKMMNADPNRVGGSFIASIRNTMEEARKEMQAEQKRIQDGFQTTYGMLYSQMKFLWDSPDVKLSEKVCQALDDIITKSEEFAGNTTKDITSFMNALSSMRNRLKMTDKEYNQMVEALYPYLKQITDFYAEFEALPQKYQAYISNLVINQMKQDAEKIRQTVMESFDLKQIPDGIADYVKTQFDVIDDLMKNSYASYNARLKGMLDGYKDIQDFFSRATLEEVLKYREEYQKAFTFTLDWKINTGDVNKNKSFTEMGKKYGEEFNKSFFGVLATISKSDNFSEQMEYLVKNYDKAIKQVEQINKDFAEAFKATNNDAFKNAMIDESIIIPQLRQLYEKAKLYMSQNADFETQKLEAQGRYNGELNRELKIEADLLEIEEKELNARKYKYQTQLAYLNGIRDEVYALEKNYNEVNAMNSTQIANLEKRLQELQSEAAIFDATTSEEVLKRNQEEQNRIQQLIDQKKKEIQDALAKLAETGFMSVEDVDAMAKQIANSIISTNNAIQDNTRATTKNVADQWYNAFSSVVGGIGQMSSAFTNLFTEMGEMNERYAEFAEAASYMSIGLSMAEGLAYAIAKGMEMGWPAAAVMIPVGIATVVSGIAEAFAVHNQYKNTPKFATGGVIGGRTARTRSEGRRDDINIKASKGEYIINAETVKDYGIDFFDNINFGRKIKKFNFAGKYAEGGYVSSGITAITNEQLNMDNMRNMVVDAVSEIHPQVSVTEINQMQNRVAVKEKIAKNK